MNARRRLGRLTAALVAAAGLATATPAPSSANHTIGHWQWSGGLWPSGGGNGKCVWYVAKSACPGWNYWYAIYTLQGNRPDGGNVLPGFENNERIRGRYLYSGQSVTVYPSELGMGGYLVAHVTYWDGYSTTSVYAESWL
jgi:hypothetical protein